MVDACHGTRVPLLEGREPEPPNDRLSVVCSI